MTRGQGSDSCFRNCKNTGVNMTEFAQLTSGYTLNPDLPRAHRKKSTVVMPCFIPYFPFLLGPKREIALTNPWPL